MSSKTRSDELWAARAAKWKASGLSVEDFVVSEGVKPGSTTWWRRQLARAARGSGPQMSFVRLVNGESEARSASVPDPGLIEVVLPNRIRLRLPIGVSSLQLSTLIAGAVGVDVK